MVSKKKTIETIEKQDIDIDAMFTKVKELPTSKREATGNYINIVKRIMQLDKGTYQINLDMIKKGISMKSVYPSLDRAIELFLEKSVKLKRPTLKDNATDKEKEQYETDIKKYLNEKKQIVRLRTVATDEKDKDNKTISNLYIEKLIDKPLTIEE